MTLLTDIRDHLDSKQEVRDRLHGRIYHGRAPQGATKPYLLLNRVAGQEPSHLGNQANAALHVVQVDVYDTDPLRGHEVAEELRLVLSGANNATWGDTYIHGVTIVRALDEDQFPPDNNSADWVYRFGRDYQVTFAVTVPTN